MTRILMTTLFGLALCFEWGCQTQTEPLESDEKKPRNVLEDATPEEISAVRKMIEDEDARMLEAYESQEFFDDMSRHESPANQESAELDDDTDSLEMPSDSAE
ncbi:hypothetical protein [Aporhodopirellula aestuarii]|uniref:Secreted protein n=1 Tax=Aporhodopirellula aestuarii TaxID=2950107 RepID=A0ABT0UCW4_9BACT|nr:hypothetical protein [Aporhodopirellula aestuarii]MCM2374872.1 hypothetical protein [Aporhodopirellula aestuarii]